MLLVNHIVKMAILKVS